MDRQLMLSAITPFVPLILRLALIVALTLCARWGLRLAARLVERRPEKTVPNPARPARLQTPGVSGGDVIKVGEVTGGVERITLRATYLRDIEGRLHIVPNGDIRLVSNLTAEWARAGVGLHVGS